MHECILWASAITATSSRSARQDRGAERYFDFVCLLLSFLSAASLANRSSLSRAVFARTAWPPGTYWDMACAPSMARCAFWVFLNRASAGPELRTRAAPRPQIGRYAIGA